MSHSTAESPFEYLIQMLRSKHTKKWYAHCIHMLVGNPDLAKCLVTMTGTTASKVTLQVTCSGDSNNLGSYRTAKLTTKPWSADTRRTTTGRLTD